MNTLEQIRLYLNERFTVLVALSAFTVIICAVLLDGSVRRDAVKERSEQASKESTIKESIIKESIDRLTARREALTSELLSLRQQIIASQRATNEAITIKIVLPSGAKVKTEQE
jgi:hypothetical protein